MSSPTQLKTGTLLYNFQHIEGQAEIVVGSGSVGNFNDDPHAMVCGPQKEVYSHFGRIVKGAVGAV